MGSAGEGKGGDWTDGSKVNEQRNLRSKKFSNLGSWNRYFERKII